MVIGGFHRPTNQSGYSEGEMQERENLWDCMTVLAAQLSRHPYDLW
ncbi:MAG TPA: hypothetical protein VE619_11265 [Nitrososphaeraceae archaeon]|jgi:hypothetical protein|nr:hypothetical protein [Nitrososphaeraceae archaeon]